jgi:SAM-dependent methyltransferase
MVGSQRRAARNAATVSLPADVSAERWVEWTQSQLDAVNPITWLSERWNFERPLYREIMSVTPDGGRILEVGTGGGPNALWLASRGYEVTGVEYRQPLVDIARGLARTVGVRAMFEVGDAFDLAKYRGYDTVFSVGMVEHWPYDDSVRAIREQGRTASVVVVNIPTIFTRYSSPVTDERFYSRGELKRMLQDAGLNDVRVYGYGEVAGPVGRLSRSLWPDIPHRLVLQRHFGWPSASLVGVGSAAALRTGH